MYANERLIATIILAGTIMSATLFMKQRENAADGQKAGTLYAHTVTDARPFLLAEHIYK